MKLGGLLERLGGALGVVEAVAVDLADRLEVFEAGDALGRLEHLAAQVEGPARVAVGLAPGQHRLLGLAAVRVHAQRSLEQLHGLGLVALLLADLGEPAVDRGDRLGVVRPGGRGDQLLVAGERLLPALGLKQHVGLAEPRDPVHAVELDHALVDADRPVAAADRPVGASCP